MSATKSEGPARTQTENAGAAMPRWLIVFEVAAVLGVSLGASAALALLMLIDSLSRAATAPGTTLANQQTTVLTSHTSRPWLDLAYQCYDLGVGLAPVLLVAYLLAREGASLRALGIDGRQPLRDLAHGAGVAAVIGAAGLGLYLAAHAAGFALTIVPSNLPAAWWRIPVMVAMAFQQGTLEEVVVLGYLLRRLDNLGWPAWRSHSASALLRGTYHLYQGFGAFAGNVVMGLIFAHLYRRWGRVMPLLLAHGLVNTAAFVGYALLAGKVSWLPV